MAYDKIITIRARLDDCLRYVQDGDKTALSHALDYIEDSGKTALDDEVILQSAINCTLETCYQDMQYTKERFGKPGGVVGYHLVHSYAPGETTPELAHEAGVEFARRLLGDKYQAVVCTHVKELYALRREQPSEQLDADIDSLTAQLRPLRRELRLCGKIAEYSPRMLRQVRENNTPPTENHAPDKARERRHSLWR